MAMKAQDVFAILNSKMKKMSGGGSSFSHEEVIVNENGELEVVETLGQIYIDFNDAYLKTDIKAFSVDKDGYLIVK